MSHNKVLYTALSNFSQILHFVLSLPFTDDLGDLELIEESSTRYQVFLLHSSVKSL